MATCPKRQMGRRAASIAMTAMAVSGTLFAGANQWTRVGPEGGQVLRLAVDPRTPSTVYARTGGGELFKTADAGASWSAVNSGLPSSALGMAIDPHNSGTVYALASCGIYKTRDGGASWSAINSGLNLSNRDCIVSLAIDSRNPGTLYASGFRGTLLQGIFKTTDGGSSWIQVSSGFPSDGQVSSGFDDPAFFGAALAVDPQTSAIYAAGSRRLFKSIDGGASWSPADSGLVFVSPNGQVEPLRVEALAFDPQTPGTLYAGGQSKIFKSTDGGASWSDASFGLAVVLPVRRGEVLFSQARVLSLAINPQTPAVIYAVLYQSPRFVLVTSTDGAASWTTATDPLFAANNVNTLTPDPQEPGTLYLGTDQGVLKSTDRGGRWNLVNSGLRATAIRSVIIDSQTAGTIFAVNGSPGPPLLKSRDGGRSWVPSNFGLSWSIASLVAHPQDPRILYILGSRGPSGALFKSEDAGGSWAEIWTGPSGTFVGSLAIDPQNPNILYAGHQPCTPVGPGAWNCGTYSRVAKSIDAGRTWTESQVSLKGKWCCGSWISSVVIDPQNPNILYAGTTDANGTGPGLWKSADAGVSWVNLTIDGDISSIAIDPRNPSTIYASNGWLWKSMDGGQTWAKATARFPEGYGGPVAIDPQNSDTLYYTGWEYGTDRYEVLKSTDAGASWASVSSGLTNWVDSLAIDPQNPRTVYAGTSGGLFAITFAPQPPRSRSRLR